MPAIGEVRDEARVLLAPLEQIVVAGTEAHVCVLHTCMDLLAEGRQVFVVADAVGSRKPLDREAALARLRQNGAQIVTREMVAFDRPTRSASVRVLHCVAAGGASNVRVMTSTT